MTIQALESNYGAVYGNGEDAQSDVQTESPYDPVQPQPAQQQQQAQGFVMHRVQPNDTLQKLALLYGVSTDMIRFANEFVGDDIYYFRELKIPVAGEPHNRRRQGNPSATTVSGGPAGSIAQDPDLHPR